MFRLFANLFLLAVILMLIKIPFGIYRPEPIVRKRAEWSAGRYNTIFVGSSRTMDAVNAGQFDAATNGEANSFNMGVPGGLPPETIEWCEEVIKTSPSLRYIFFEVSGTGDGLAIRQLPPRAFRLTSYPEIVGRLPGYALSDYHDRVAVELFRPVVASDGVFGRARGVRSRRDLETSLFYNQHVSDNVDGRLTEGETVYLMRLRSLVRLAEEHNVTVLFFIPPRIETENELETVRAVYPQLPSTNKIDGGHANADLYTIESSIDEYHLNERGAVVFTARLAAAFGARLRAN